MKSGDDTTIAGANDGIGMISEMVTVGAGVGDGVMTVDSSVIAGVGAEVISIELFSVGMFVLSAVGEAIGLEVSSPLPPTSSCAGVGGRDRNVSISVGESVGEADGKVDVRVSGGITDGRTLDIASVGATDGRKDGIPETSSSITSDSDSAFSVLQLKLSRVIASTTPSPLHISC